MMLIDTDQASDKEWAMSTVPCPGSQFPQVCVTWILINYKHQLSLCADECVF